MRVGVGRIGRESKLQIPMPYPVRWDRTSALPQYSHCSTPVCPRTALVPGLPVLPSTAQGSAVRTGPISCHTVGQSQGLGWSWPSWFGLDSVSRSTGPALVVGAVTPRLPFYYHSSLSSRLSSESYMQRHGVLHLFSHEEMVVMAPAWPGSGVACAWCRRACQHRPRTLPCLSMGKGCRGPSLGLPFYKTLFHVLSKVNKLHRSDSCQKLGYIADLSEERKTF